MKNLTVLFATGGIILMQNLTAFSQGKSDTTCLYQAPPITCQQAQKNVNAIVKYGIILKSIEIKDEMIRVKVNELSSVKAGFVDERKLSKLTLDNLTKNYEREQRRKKRWRFLTVVLSIVAGAFYLK